MIQVLAKLMKPLAEDLTPYDKSYIELHSIGGDIEGEISIQKYQHGPEKYSLNNLNLSLLSLLVNDLSKIILESGCPCSRPTYSGAPYVHYDVCYAVFHLECFFCNCETLDGEKMNCPGSHKEVG